MLLTADSTTQVQFDHQNWPQDKTYVCILDTLHFKHTRSVALVNKPPTGHVSLQYHVVFDDDFTMVPNMETGTIPPHWSDLIHSSSELASKQALILAQTWLGSTGQYNTNLKFMDNSVVDHFAIVTDHTKEHPPRSGT
jgi:hypothetical protein